MNADFYKNKLINRLSAQNMVIFVQQLKAEGVDTSYAESAHQKRDAFLRKHS